MPLNDIYHICIYLLYDKNAILAIECVEIVYIQRKCAFSKIEYFFFESIFTKYV